MPYEVIKADEQGFTLWDGQRDPRHPKEKISTMWIPGPHPFHVGDRVEMLFRLIQEPVQIVHEPPDDKAPWCEVHNARHILGPNCKVPIEVVR